MYRTDSVPYRRSVWCSAYLTARELSVKRIYFKTRACAICSHWRKIPGSLTYPLSHQGTILYWWQCKNLLLWKYESGIYTSLCHYPSSLITTRHSHLLTSQLSPVTLPSLCSYEPDFSRFHTWASEIFAAGRFMLCLFHPALLANFNMKWGGKAPHSHPLLGGQF